MTEEQRKKENKRRTEWKKENRDRINFLMPKGYKDMIIAAAENKGISAAAWIRSAIDDKLLRDRSGNV